MFRANVHVSEFSNDRCVPSGAADDIELSAFDRTCYEFSVGRGGSFEEARSHCKKHGGDLVHGLRGATSSFLLAELERRKPNLKTQLVWIGAQREPGISRTWRWVDGESPFSTASLTNSCLYRFSFVLVL
jgi:hypothetical protein